MILHVTTERGWRGGERQLLLLARELGRRGLAQQIAAPRGSPLAFRASAAGLEVVLLQPSPAWHPGSLVALLRWLRRHPGALLHSHSSPALSLAALARRLAPAAGVVHTRRVAYPVRRAAKHRTAADRYVAVSQAVADGLLAAGLAAKRLRVIPSCADLETCDTAVASSEWARVPPAPLVGCVAHLAPEKGLSVLLAAWSEVATAMPGARLLLVGDGPERARLERTAASFVPDSVVFTGQRDDVAACLKALDLYVQPSLAEGLGTSVLDAMACGLPVVASRVGGLPEAVADGETGLLVPPGDPSALATAVLELLRDPERAAAMGAAGRRRVEEHFTLERMVEGYLMLYRELLGG